jgi:hypothetical protein
MQEISGPGYVSALLVAASCEQINEVSGSIKARNFLTTSIM